MLRHRWKILIGIVLVFVVWTGIQVTTIGNGPKKEVEAYKKSLVAKGEKLEISEFLPPPIPPGQNGADALNQAFRLLTPEDYDDSNSIPAMLMIAPAKAIVCFEQPDVCEYYFTNSWADELAVVADDCPMTELLRRVTDYQAIDFYLDYSNNIEKQLQIIETLLCSTRRLSTEAMCDLNRGNASSAVTNICAILTLVNGEQDERLTSLQFVRMDQSETAAQISWELMQSSNANDSDLALLQTKWERLRFIRPMENAILMERAIDESDITKMQKSDEYFNQRTGWTARDVDWSDGWREGFDDLFCNTRVVCAKSMYHASWIYWDELHLLQDDQITLQTIRVIETNQSFNPSYSNMMNQLDSQAADKPRDWLASIDHEDYKLVSGASEWSGAVALTMNVEAMRSIVVTAIALKRYRLKHGKYPSTLSDLVPQFVSSVPQDPVDGKPLRYRLMPDGNYLLYSIGENGKDDGGDGSFGKTTGRDYPSNWTNRRALDWVWPQPATPAEIQYFYAHPPH